MKKTKKALLAALACSAVLAGAFGLAACTPGGEGGDGTHKHKWGNWTVATEPTGETAGKATRTCSGSGDCDAKATDKEATLPVLSPTDYTITNDTATCQAAGSATYTYNKGGVNVSFTAATPVNPENHTSDCGHGQAAAHVHQWSDWVLSDTDLLYYNGTATRECSAAGCDAEDEDLTVTIPSVRNSDDYTYEEPVHKTTATCQVQGVDTYTYTDSAKGISVSFDIQTGYGDHVFENNECTVCHKTITVLTLDTEVTVNATAEESLYSFTAATEGWYEINYTEGSGAKVAIGYYDALPYKAKFDAGEKVMVSMAAPEGTESETYKIKVVPVTVLEPDYGTEENEINPYETPTKTTVNVGGGKTVRLDVSGLDYGIISYNGNTPIVITYNEYAINGDPIPQTITMAGTNAPGVQESFSVNLGSRFNRRIYELTVSSTCDEAFDAEISLLLSEENPDTKYVISLDVEKSFEGIDYFGQIYTVQIAEDGDYTFTVKGDDAEYVFIDVGTDEEVYETVEANEDGSYALEAGTYYILISSGKDEVNDTVSGTLTVSKVAEEGANPVVGEAFTVTGVDPTAWPVVPKKYTIELEAGEYQVLINGQAMEFNLASAVMIGSEYEYFMGEYMLTPFEPKEGSEDKIIVIETSGTYFLEVTDNITFTVVKVEE